MAQTARMHEIGEASGSHSVAARLAEHATRYVKVIAGIPVVVKAPFSEGHVCSAKEARALNWAYANRAGSVANSTVTRQMKDKPDDEKVAYLNSYMNGGYSFSDDLGSEFSRSLLEIAADRVVFDLAKQTGDYWDHVDSEEVAKRKPVVDKLLAYDNPAKLEKYVSDISEKIALTLSERHAIQTRKARGEEASLAIEL
jgi:hypothetical protein